MSGRQLDVAAIQATPTYLDREATLTHAADLTRQHGARGADLVVFPESFASFRFGYAFIVSLHTQLPCGALIG